jgi:DNA-binding response OmpR family regulator
MAAERETTNRWGNGPAQGSSVLVVDDERPVCDLLKDFLIREGYDVHVAYTALDALQSMDRHQPEIVLLDIRLPEMDGVECLRRIRASKSHPAVIMVTAVEDENVGRECLNLGAFEYVTKPVSLDRLKTCLLLTQLFLQSPHQ